VRPGAVPGAGVEDGADAEGLDARLPGREPGGRREDHRAMSRRGSGNKAAEARSGRRGATALQPSVAASAAIGLGESRRAKIRVNRCGRADRRDAGFTLLELVVAMGILTAFLVMLVQLLASGTRLVDDGERGQSLAD